MFQPFALDLHWHNLALCGPDKIAYYWEPFGKSLDCQRTLGPPAAALAKCLPTGWRVESLLIKLQTDGYQCGVWADWFCNRFAEYVIDSRCGTRSFGVFLLQGQSELLDLTAPLTSSARRLAGKGNERFVQKRRTAMCALLRCASERNQLPQAHARLAVYNGDADDPVLLE